MSAQILVRTPESISLLAVSSIIQHLQLASADVVEESMERQTTLSDSPLNGRMLLQHLDRLLDIEFCNAVTACIVIGQLLQLHFVPSPQSGTCLVSC
jgi:hypothetical protein